MKTIRFEPNVPAELRAIDQWTALSILHAIHRYAETGAGDVRPLTGEFEGFLRLRPGDYRIFFQETIDILTIHHIRNRREAYRSA